MTENSEFSKIEEAKKIKQIKMNWLDNSEQDFVLQKHKCVQGVSHLNVSRTMMDTSLL